MNYTSLVPSVKVKATKSFVAKGIGHFAGQSTKVAEGDIGFASTLYEDGSLGVRWHGSPPPLNQTIVWTDCFEILDEKAFELANAQAKKTSFERDWGKSFSEALDDLSYEPWWQFGAIVLKVIGIAIATITAILGISSVLGADVQTVAAIASCVMLVAQIFWFERQ